MVGFVHRILLAGTAAVLLTVSGAGEAAHASQANPAAASRAAEKPRPHSEQAYSLSPDKLAEAKALNRIRVGVAIAGSVWGLIVLWALLATGTATRLDMWTR